MKMFIIFYIARKTAKVVPAAKHRRLGNWELHC